MLLVHSPPYLEHFHLPNVLRKKNKKNNTTPEKISSTPEQPFVLVKYKRKRLGETRQFSITDFSPTTTKPGVKLTTMQNKIEKCCNYTERSTCADRNCACVKREVNCTNCNCLKQCVNHFVSYSTTSKPKPTSSASTGKKK